MIYILKIYIKKLHFDHSVENRLEVDNSHQARGTNCFTLNCDVGVECDIWNPKLSRRHS